MDGVVEYDRLMDIVDGVAERAIAAGERDISRLVMPIQVMAPWGKTLFMHDVAKFAVETFSGKYIDRGKVLEMLGRIRGAEGFCEFGAGISSKYVSKYEYDRLDEFPKAEVAGAGWYRRGGRGDVGDAMSLPGSVLRQLPRVPVPVVPLYGSPWFMRTGKAWQEGSASVDKTADDDWCEAMEEILRKASTFHGYMEARKDGMYLTYSREAFGLREGPAVTSDDDTRYFNSKNSGSDISFSRVMTSSPRFSRSVQRVYRLDSDSSLAWEWDYKEIPESEFLDATHVPSTWSGAMLCLPPYPRDINHGVPGYYANNWFPWYAGEKAALTAQDLSDAGSGTVDREAVLREEYGSEALSVVPEYKVATSRNGSVDEFKSTVAHGGYELTLNRVYDVCVRSSESSRYVEGRMYYNDGTGEGKCLCDEDSKEGWTLAEDEFTGRGGVIKRKSYVCYKRVSDIVRSADKEGFMLCSWSMSGVGTDGCRAASSMSGMAGTAELLVSARGRNTTGYGGRPHLDRIDTAASSIPTAILANGKADTTGYTEDRYVMDTFMGPEANGAATGSGLVPVRVLSGVWDAPVPEIGAASRLSEAGDAIWHPIYFCGMPDPGTSHWYSPVFPSGEGWNGETKVYEPLVPGEPNTDWSLVEESMLCFTGEVTYPGNYTDNSERYGCYIGFFIPGEDGGQYYSSPRGDPEDSVATSTVHVGFDIVDVLNSPEFSKFREEQ